MIKRIWHEFSFHTVFMKLVAYFISPRQRLGDVKHTTRFINTVWNENSFQILYIYDAYIINFCRPHTRVFYFFVQKEGHHLAASLLISLCQEHFICPICDNCTALVVCPYMRIFPLLNRSDVFLAPLTRRQKNSSSNSKTTINVPEQSRQCTFMPCQTCALCKSRMKASSYIY